MLSAPFVYNQCSCCHEDTDKVDVRFLHLQSKDLEPDFSQHQESGHIHRVTQKTKLLDCLSYLCQIVTDFQNSFTDRLGSLSVKEF